MHPPTISPPYRSRKRTPGARVDPVTISVFVCTIILSRKYRSVSKLDRSSMFHHHIIYVRPMVDRAKAWAEGKGLSRKNPVHGEDEYRIPTQWNFSHSDKERTSTKASSKTQLKARPITVFIEYVLLFHRLREDHPIHRLAVRVGKEFSWGTMPTSHPRSSLCNIAAMKSSVP